MVNELCPIRDLSDACWHKITTVDMTVSDMKKAKIRGGLVSVSADQENATHQSKKKKLDLKNTTLKLSICSPLATELQLLLLK